MIPVKIERKVGRLAVILLLALAVSPGGAQTIDISADELRNRIRGGIIGQFFGNLNGLEHEFKYLKDPGNLTSYTPDLSNGARTDDDTDIEFPYIYHMQRSGNTFLPYTQVRDIWIQCINDKIWCSNRYARSLMDLGFEPPYTGRIAMNPWAVFNISGQFLCESFGIISPGMPQTAGRIGTHYTLVAIDGEPAQTTLFFDAMLAAAFFESDVTKLVEVGLASMDKASEQHKIINNVVSWHQKNKDNWKATRQSIKNTYWNGDYGNPGGSNGYRVTTASTVASLLHGEGAFAETLRMAFNFGWDADNTAAMVGAVMGIIHGEKWLRSQGWKIKDVYENTHRPGLPTELTITSFSDMHYEVAHTIILENGGKEIELYGKPGYRIAVQEPVNVIPLPEPLHRINAMRKQWMPRIERDLCGSEVDRVRAVYAATALGLVPDIVANQPKDWKGALDRIQTPINSEVSPYEALHWLINDTMWSSEEKAYFQDVLVNKNMDPVCPFDYGK